MSQQSSLFSTNVKCCTVWVQRASSRSGQSWYIHNIVYCLKKVFGPKHHRSWQLLRELNSLNLQFPHSTYFPSTTCINTLAIKLWYISGIIEHQQYQKTGSNRSKINKYGDDIGDNNNNNNTVAIIIVLTVALCTLSTMIKNSIIC